MFRSTAVDPASSPYIPLITHIVGIISVIFITYAQYANMLEMMFLHKYFFESILRTRCRSVMSVGVSTGDESSDSKGKS